MSTLPAHPFPDACGQRRPLRLAVDDATGYRVAEGELDQPFALIGSDAECEIQLLHPAVPARLTFLQVLDGNVLLVELARRGVRVLTAGTPLTLGPFALHLLVPPTDTPLPPPVNPLWPHPPDPRLPSFRLVPVASAAPRPITQRLTVLGEATDGGPVAYLTLTPAGLFVTDLHAGTRVNGKPVRAARLVVGDELRLGTDRYTVQPDVTAAERREANRVSEALLGVSALDAPPAHATAALVPVRSAAPFAPQLPPEAAALLRQFGNLQCDILAGLRQELDAMLHGFDTLHREDLAAFAERLGHLHDLIAQLTREPRAGGVTTLASQPVELTLSPMPVSVTPPPPEPHSVSEQTAAVHQALFERLSGLSSDARPGLWQRLRGLLGRRPEPTA